MPALQATDSPDAAAELAAEVARGVDGVDAFEARADEQADRTLVVRDDAFVAARRAVAACVGVTVYAGGGVSHAYVTDVERATLRAQIERAVRLARRAGAGGWRRVEPAFLPARAIDAGPSLRIHPATATNEEIVDLLRAATRGARDAEAASSAEGAFAARLARVSLVASNGTRARLESAVTTLRVLASIRGDRLGSGAARLAGERGIEDYAADGVAARLGAEAATRARESLSAIALPSGRYRILCDNELSGTLAHESFGHLAEHDLVASGWSTLQGRLGETLAAPGVSISDAPVAPGDPRAGVAVRYDDQGTPGERVRILRDGVLSTWMHTRESAAAEGHEPGGNGRALAARFPAIVRMRNTYFEAGDHRVEEALEALGDGLYLLGARGGAPHSDGSFMFTAVRGYRVERGRIAEPVRTRAIHGNILEFLRNVELCTRDVAVTTNAFGGCGKGEQSFLPVGVGGSQVLVRDALVGGI